MVCQLLRLSCIQGAPAAHSTLLCFRSCKAALVRYDRAALAALIRGYVQKDLCW
jgi:hypothetical protein